MSPLERLSRFFTASRPSAPSRRDARRGTLSLESLEKRQVMAGNVTVAWANNALQISGDTKDNQVTITEVGATSVQITGHNNTTINGRSGSFVFSNPSDNLKIVMGSGNDLVLLGKNDGRVSRFDNVVVSMGAGSDTVAVRNTVAYGEAFSSFNLGDEYENEIDQFTVERSTFRAVAIGTGGGDDRVYSSSSTMTKALISTGAGHDVVDLRNTLSAELAVSLGAGDDRFASWNSHSSRSRWVDGGSGWDGLRLGTDARTGQFSGFNEQQKW